MSFRKDNSAYYVIFVIKFEYQGHSKVKSNMTCISLDAIIIKMIIFHFLNSRIRCNTAHLFHFVYILVHSSINDYDSGHFGFDVFFYLSPT